MLAGSWNKRYGDYIREKQERDRVIALQYDENTTNTTTNTTTDQSQIYVTEVHNSLFTVTISIIIHS
jgi:hypothetical protein